MSLIVKMAMTSCDADNFSPNPQFGTLCIERLEPIVHGTDTYLYTVKFKAVDWRKGRWSGVVRFQHEYSNGILWLMARAIDVLIKRYPELQAGRFGVPRNRIKCRLCGTQAWSQFTHDFSSCSCGAVSTDGGYDYVMRNGEPENIIEVKEPWQSDLKKAKKSRAPSAVTSAKASRTKPMQSTSTSTRGVRANTSASAATKTGRKRAKTKATRIDDVPGNLTGFTGIRCHRPFRPRRTR